MDEGTAYREIISRILCLKPGDERIVSVKIDACREFKLPSVPKNSALLAAALPGERETLRRLLLVKPTRTLSGVAPIAVMTSPAPCPHGKCLPCPGGPD
ncbi:MAG: tRNA uridine(34) 5-carboxymethylaminomethyl modification radical SAM/GNAT enzyme Elp3, partial [Methanoregula sp.]|nr:tRNA uridine(34) 5-carboxymethylaminomethyl modification radical SAM/GNAT enzyme Elp3 [Methanoregula sp.]